MRPVLRRVGADRLVDASMMDEVSLSVSSQIVPAEPDRSGREALDDAGRPGMLRRIVGAVRMLRLRKADLNRVNSSRHAHALSPLKKIPATDDDYTSWIRSPRLILPGERIVAYTPTAA